MNKLGRNLGVIAIVLLMLAPLLFRSHIGPLHLSLLLVPVSALVGLIAVVISLVAMRRGGLSAIGLIAGLVPLAFFAVVIVSGHGLPMIHDITTDTVDPPTFVDAPKMRKDALNPLDYNKDNVALQQKAFPDVHGIETNESPAAAFDHAKLVAQSMGWEIYGNDPANGRIEAVETTKLFGFKDDVAIRVRPREGGSIVDLRSVSRVGEGDLGANAKRIRRFIAAYGRGSAG